MSAREEVLGRVRAALRGAPPAAVDVPPEPPSAPMDHATMLDVFVERVADYRAVVVRCGEGEVADAVRDGLADSATVVVPQGFPAQWLSAATAEQREDEALTARDLDAVDAVVTTARVGIALTGTIVLDHAEGQGRRILSLVPDRHVCVVREDQVVVDVPDALARLDPVRPQTWVSGPSATSDIELDRVEGVHGPRTLFVVVVGA